MVIMSKETRKKNVRLKKAQMNNRSNDEQRVEGQKKKWGEMSGKDNKKGATFYHSKNVVNIKQPFRWRVSAMQRVKHTHTQTERCIECVVFRFGVFLLIEFRSLGIQHSMNSSFRFFETIRLRLRRRRRHRFSTNAIAFCYGVNHAAFSNSYEIHSVHFMTARHNLATRIYSEQNT